MYLQFFLYISIIEFIDTRPKLTAKHIRMVIGKHKKNLIRLIKRLSNRCVKVV